VHRAQLKEAVPPLLARWQPLLGLKIGRSGVLRRRCAKIGEPGNLRRRLCPGVERRDQEAEGQHENQYGSWLDGEPSSSFRSTASSSARSGVLKGKRLVGGGRAPVRAALFMPALVGTRCNPVIRAFYHRLRAAGKPKKVLSPRACANSSRS
jgi:hypothetical protein